MWWIDLDRTPGVRPAALSLLFSAGLGRGGGEEVRKKGRKKLVGQDNGNLLKQKQRQCAKQRKTKYLFSISHQQMMSSHFLGSGALVHTAVAPGDKSHNNKCHPPLLA